MSVRSPRLRTHEAQAARQPLLAERRRAQLLEAAGEVFARVGYQAATIREICTRAGANVAAVNYHFGDKLELYTEVLRRSVGVAQKEAIRNAFDQQTGSSQILRQVILMMLQKMCGGDRPAWHFRLMAHELAQPTPAMSRVINEALQPIYDRLRELIGAILRLPRNHETTRLCTHSVIGQVAHYAHSRVVLARLWPELEMTPERLEQIANHIADFSLAYLRDSGPRRRKSRPQMRREGNDRTANNRKSLGTS
jgi:TetR/AcrR family transcriptional regulator, regulator of cefoperazone and chloramphenicol sensitivity